MSYTQVSIFLFACFTRHRNKEKKEKFSVRFFFSSAEEIKDNKLYRIGIKMKILLYNIFHFVCVYVCKEQVRRQNEIKSKKNTLEYTFI